MIAAVTPAAFALEDTENNINADYYEFTAEEIAAQRFRDAQLDEEAAIEAADRVARGVTDVISYSAPVTLVKQENDYYCGPASVKMIYEGITGDRSHNQLWFANKIGTTSAGSSSGQLKSALNSLLSKNYSVVNASNQSQTTFYNNISNSLKKKCPVIVNIKTIPDRYTVASKGHFIVVYASQYNTLTGAISYLYNDPNNNKKGYFGQYSISNSNLYSAANSAAGNYICAS